MFENSRRGRQARNFTTNGPEILYLKSSFEQICSPKIDVGCPDLPLEPTEDRIMPYHVSPGHVYEN